MEIILLLVYILILVLLIVNLIKYFKNKIKCGKLIIFEILSIILALFLCIYYDNLPGYGLMPGLTYFGEFIFSFGAAILYGIIFLITLITKIIRKCLNNKKIKLTLVIFIILFCGYLGMFLIFIR